MQLLQIHSLWLLAAALQELPVLLLGIQRVDGDDRHVVTAKGGAHLREAHLGLNEVAILPIHQRR